MAALAHKVEWIDGGREPQCEPDPRWPNGMVIDISIPDWPSCRIELPYPSPRCGTLMIDCEVCRVRISLTTAGRADDPREITIPCRLASDAKQ